MSKSKDAAPSAPQEIIPPAPAGKPAKADRYAEKVARKAEKEREAEIEGLMSEIEADLREEELRKLWERYGKIVIAAVVVLVLAVAGVQLWRQHAAEQREELANRFDQAENDLAQGKNDDALGIFADVAKAKGDGYATLAALDRAGLLLKKNDIDGAVAIYKSVAADTTVDRVFRDLATVLQVLHTLDRADPKTLEPLLTPLMSSGNSFHSIATELSVLIAGKEGDRARAAKLADELVNDPSTPSDMRQRAQDLAAYYKAPIDKASTEKATSEQAKAPPPPPAKP